MLRDYQQQAVNKVIGSWYRWFLPTKRVGIQSPTGSGKTRIIEQVINEVLYREPDTARILVVVPTIKIHTQFIQALSGNGLHISQVGNGRHSYDGQVVIAIINSLHDCPPVFTHVIVDEAHLFDNARFYSLYRRLRRARFAGFTATFKGKPFWIQKIIHIQKRKPLQAQGYLAKPVIKTVKARTFADVFAIWQRMAGNRKTIVFASDCNESYLLSLYMQSQGVNACHVESTTHPMDRVWAERYAQVITNVRVYREGADIADIGCVVLLTQKDRHHFIQMVGRGLRPDTADCLVLCVNHKGHKLEA